MSLEMPAGVVDDKEDKKNFGEDAILITDEDLSEEIYGSFQGFKFICPVCKVASIMVNSDVTPMCLKCGRRAAVVSKMFEEYKARRPA